MQTLFKLCNEQKPSQVGQFNVFLFLSRHSPNLNVVNFFAFLIVFIVDNLFLNSKCPWDAMSFQYSLKLHLSHFLIASSNNKIVKTIAFFQENPQNFDLSQIIFFEIFKRPSHVKCM